VVQVAGRRRSGAGSSNLCAVSSGRVSLADLGFALSPARSQGNYIGPEGAVRRRHPRRRPSAGALRRLHLLHSPAAGPRRPRCPTRGPLDGMEVDGECSQDLPQASRSLEHARRASLDLLLRRLHLLHSPAAGPRRPRCPTRGRRPAQCSYPASRTTTSSRTSRATRTSSRRMEQVQATQSPR
jgi:hypothetical protein